MPLLLNISCGVWATTTWIQSFSLAGLICHWHWKSPECATEYLLTHPKQMWHTWRLNRAVECEDHLLSDSAYLQHDRADVSYTLSDGLWSAGDCDSPLRRVRQHVSCHLNLGACGLNIARQTRNKGYLLLKRAHHQPNWNVVSSTLQITHFDMQGAAASQIAVFAPIFEEACANIVHSEWAFSFRRSLQA